MAARLAAALLFCALAACTRPSRGGAGQPAQPQVVLHGVRIRYYQGDQLAADSRVARVTYQRDSADISADEAFVSFHGQGALSGTRAPGVAGMDVRAARVQGNLTARQADGFDGVTLKTGSGLKGETQRAHFDGVAQEARGSEPISVWGPGYWLDAHGFRFRLPEEELEFEGGVDSRLVGVR
jgi:lipopolysaccharide export system protein LptC